MSTLDVERVRGHVQEATDALWEVQRAFETQVRRLTSITTHLRLMALATLCARCKCHVSGTQNIWHAVSALRCTPGVLWG
jgi:hypothetical protein